MPWALPAQSLRRNGAYADLHIEVDLDALSMTWAVSGKMPDVEAMRHFRHTFFGRVAPPTRKPGPWLGLPSEKTTVSIDPRPLAR